MTWILLLLSFGAAYGWVKVRRSRKARSGSTAY